jgi:hypothetical protein
LFWICGGVNYYGLNGSQTVYPTQTTTYTISCTGTGGVPSTSQTTVYVGTTGGTGTTITANSTTDAMSYRNMVGQTVTVYCPANLSQSQIWGTDTYSDDSAICTAAVHAGKINFATGGTVYIVIGSSQNTFTATYRNGVTSTYYGYWPGSYTFTGSGTGTNGNLTLTANPVTINSGQPSTIGLLGSVLTNTYSVPVCTITGGSLSNSNFPVYFQSGYNYAGTLAVYPTQTTTYNVTCTSSGLTSTGSVVVNVNGSGTGNLSVTANPATITSGQTSTIGVNGSSFINY